jgi:hypothetical protein
MVVDGEVKVAEGQRLTARVKKFLAHYGGDCALDATKAAQKAGYRHPQKAGSRVKGLWPELVRKAEDEYRAKMVMSAREVDERLAAVARDPKHKDHVKALELLARMHGKLETKLLVGGIDRSTLNKELDDMLEMLKQQRAGEKADSSKLN